MREIDEITIHCSATKANQDIGIDDIRRWHVEQNGWADVGYHFFIRRDGTTETGRPVEIPGAHVAGHNKRSIAVCMAGGIGQDGRAECNFTFRQFSSLYRLLTHLQAQYQNAAIKGHRDKSPDLNGDGVIDQSEWLKECPTFAAKEFML